MCLIEVFIAIGMATVVPHMDCCHLGDVQGAIVPKVLYYREEMEEEHYVKREEAVVARKEEK